MADERIIYRGHSSIISILGTLSLSVIAFFAIAFALVYFRREIPQSSARYWLVVLLLIPLVVALFKWAMLKFLTYEITTQRIKITRGILSKRTDELELYRVKDTSLIEPLLYRMVGAGTISVVTADASTPSLDLKALPDAKGIREQLRVSIEECRSRKRTGVIEME